MAGAEPDRYTGGCFCGAVRYEAHGVKDIWYCHCTQCRSLTGHYMAACRTHRENLSVDGPVKWIAVSVNSEHGFCATCCSPLLWRNKTRETVSLVASNIDDTSGLEVCGHVYVGEKGGYYEITDGLPQFDTYPEGGV